MDNTNNEEIVVKTLAEELIQNAKEYEDSSNTELNNEELKLIDNIKEHMIRISKKGRLRCEYSVGRTSGYNIRKIDFDKVKKVLESEPYCLCVEVRRCRMDFNIVIMSISVKENDDSYIVE